MSETPQDYPNIRTMARNPWEKDRDEAKALLAERDALRARYTALIGVVQRWQPGGSPPPGDAEMLVAWICRTLEERAVKAGAERDALRTDSRYVRQVQKLAGIRLTLENRLNKSEAECATLRAEVERLTFIANDRSGEQQYQRIEKRADRAEAALREMCAAHNVRGEDGPCGCSGCRYLAVLRDTAPEEKPKPGARRREVRIFTWG